MPLAYVVDKLDGIAAELQPHYVKADDGKYRLDVDGAVPRDKLDEFRDNNIKLLKDLEKFKGIDPTKYASLLEIEKKVNDKTLFDSGKIEEIVTGRIQTLKDEHAGIVNGLQTQLSTSNSQLETLLIDSAVRSKATEHGAIPTAVDDVLLRAKAVFKIKDGQVIPFNGDKVIYGKDGINPMGVDEWVANLAKSASHLFVKPQGGGANGSGHNSGGNQGGKGLSSMQKIKQGLSAA